MTFKGEMYFVQLIRVGNSVYILILADIQKMYIALFKNSKYINFVNKNGIIIQLLTIEALDMM